MRTTLFKATLAGSILAAFTAGAALPAAAAQNTARKKSSKSNTSSHSSTATSASSTTSSNTSSKTSGKKSSHKGTKKVKGQATPTPERINEIQSALAKQGVYTGEPSGKWDDSTVDAVRKFQSSHGLNPSGKLDAPTLQRLGLGSETAGLAAPTPPPNAAVNRLLSSRSQQDHPDNAPDNPDN